jgi:putative Holliday junction resolvase
MSDGPATSNRRYICVDYGSRRIGLAVSDPEGRIASPLGVVECAGDVSQTVERVIAEASAEFDVDAWVVGLPLNMDGSEGPQAKVNREFASRLESATGQPVHLFDERLSSRQADIHMSQTGLTHQQKKRRRDALAAQVILQSFLDADARA